MALVRTVEDDPNAALDGLVAFTVLLEVSLAAVLVWTSADDGSWWLAGGWLLITAYLVWSTWRAARIVRRGLRRGERGTG